MPTEATQDLLKNRITKLKTWYIWRTKRDYGLTLSQTDVCKENKGYIMAIMDLIFKCYYINLRL